MLRQYPLFLLSVLKTPAFRLLDKVKVDTKIAAIYKLVTMSFNQMAVFLYPRVYPVTDLPEELESEEP
jgi:hypothetical protein